eukprot:CAMPEP_0179417204 /NCGR_PEP_ID=MMETSP0799-20121207/7237_1 /TAXON_ID=46947 /ORGANISM="Geminigera cryophila, Strain CCMP2564" /LENGTH=90 /DNA_ID=CAMNT_0021190187 /DNA_START=686 /DNA_END=958 /DNA_ORIENTATION=-
MSNEGELTGAGELPGGLTGAREPFGVPLPTRQMNLTHPSNTRGRLKTTCKPQKQPYDLRAAFDRKSWQAAPGCVDVSGGIWVVFGWFRGV